MKQKDPELEFKDSHSLPEWYKHISVSNNTHIVSDTAPLGIDTTTPFSQTTPVIDHFENDVLENILEYYDSCRSNNVDLGDVIQKAHAAFEVLMKTQAVIVEVEPWFISDKMGTDNFDRWEPFCVGFPEVAIDRQFKLTNIAPLSEVSYRIKQRDEYLQQAQNIDSATESTVPKQRNHPVVKAQIEEQKAFTRYTLDACYSPDYDTYSNPSERDDGLWIDQSIIQAVHTHLQPWPHHLILTSNENGKLHCGRGPLFDSHVTIAIDVDRRKNKQGERKVAVYNDADTKHVLNNLDFEKYHQRYLPQKARWEIDLSKIEKFVKTILTSNDVDYVSIHRCTEKAYMTHIRPQFRQDIEGYPALN